VSRFFIGVDVGGTTTTAVVLAEDREAGRAQGPGAAMRPGRGLVSATKIADVTRRALAMAGALRAEAMVVGAAGAGRDMERDELRQALRAEDLAVRLRVMGDIDIALAAAFGDGPGIVVTAGTGSVAVGRDPGGALHRSGGYGWQMGDEGGGYAIGRAALGAVGRAEDARSPATALSARIPAVTRCESFEALVRWASNATVSEVAGLAPAVLDEAALGDAVAQGIAEYAARELTQLVLHLLPFFPPGSTTSVAANGGLLQSGRPLRTMLSQKLAEDPRVVLLTEVIDPPLGAARLAARLQA
jgi:N-acetylglucosamine kinase-like BadF-type ATPase